MAADLYAFGQLTCQAGQRIYKDKQRADSGSLFLVGPFKDQQYRRQDDPSTDADQSRKKPDSGSDQQ